MNLSTFDFSNLYASAAVNTRVSADTDKENVRSTKKSKSSNELPSDRPSSLKKKKRRSDDSLDQVSGDSKVASTPLAYQLNRKHNTPTGIESIQKTTSTKKTEKSILRRSESDDMNDSIIALGLDKPKKRNKSVSFIFEEDEVAGKRIKSSVTPTASGDNSVIGTKPKSYKNINKKKASNFSTVEMSEKGDRSRENNLNADETEITPHKNKKTKKQTITDNIGEANASGKLIFGQDENKQRKNKGKKNKIHKEAPHASMEQDPVEQPSNKKNKRPKPTEIIAENLENLSIGDNANTITSLLDDMKVVDKPKKRHRNKKNKSNDEKLITNPDSSSASTDKTSTQIEAPEKKKKWKKSKKGKKKSVESKEDEASGTEGEAVAKERVTWHKRKWNKEGKTEPSEEKLASTVIVENLPLTMMLTYRKQLSDHFAKYGLIKNIGIIECYPTEESRPVFTTTVQFFSDEAATQALEEDNMVVCGARVRVRRPLPPTETTLVVRCYRGCSQQSMSSIFAPCGRVRSIREVVKGPSAMMATAFVEFDGQEAVEKALKVAAEARIGGKKVLASRYEQRGQRKRHRKSSEDAPADVNSEQEADSS